MSNIKLLVVGPNVEEQLNPFLFNNCNKDNRVFEDVTSKFLEDYNTQTLNMVVLSDGSIHQQYDPKFKVGYKTVHPEGAKICALPLKDIYPTFEKYLELHFEESMVDPEMGVNGFWYNKNARISSYMLGGSWTGFFKCKLGAQGILGTRNWNAAKPKQGWVDSIQLQDIDLEGMYSDSLSKANKIYDKFESVLQGRIIPSWKELCESKKSNETDFEKAREEYHSLEIIKDFVHADFPGAGLPFHVESEISEVFCGSREAYIQKVLNKVMLPYAILKDGEWIQRGEIIKWQPPFNEILLEEWRDNFWEMIKTLPPETQLSIIDCTI